MIGISKLYCGAVEVSDVLRYGRRSSALPSHLLQFSADKKPVVVWNCTRACNLKCRHCYAGAGGTGVSPVHAGTELSTPEAKAMIDDLAAFGCPVLLFSGGEPCTRGDLVELMAHAKARGMRVVLSTNGTLITPELARRFAEVGLSYVGVSLDGLKETHDAFRGVAGAFEQAIEGIRNVRAAGIKVGLRMTISRGNVGEIPAIFDVMKRERIERACFYHLVYAGRGSALVGEDLSHDACRAAVRTIMDETKAWFAAGGRPEILTVDNHADGPFVYLELLKENPERAAEVLELLKMNQGNSSGNGIGCVSWDGEVYADQFWRHYSFGNVRQRKFSGIWSDVSGATERSALMRKLKDKRPHVKGRCATCRWLDVCGGNFRVRAEAATGDLWSPDPACYLTDEEISGNIRGTGVPPVQAVPVLVEYPDSLCHVGQRFFSRLSPTDVHERNLPHWGQDHTLMFITFRLADALPQETLRKWQCERDEWLAKHPLPWTDAVEEEYRQTFPARLEKWLDAGSGSCVLARNDCRKIVKDALEYFNDNQWDADKSNGQDARSTRDGIPCGTGVPPVRLPSRGTGVPPVQPRYRLHSFVIMPNHVHVLMELFDKTDLPKVLHSWKSFTAKKINRVLDKSGAVWQDEYFDSLVRNERHYASAVAYIRQNAKMTESREGQAR